MSTNLPQGVVNIRGKQYQTVALRVSTFREAHKSLSLTTEVLHRDEVCVVMKATISDEAGRVLATGHAEEYRKASEINRTSALENAETSAIGRALAAFGLGGTEFASADEVARAVAGLKGDPRVSATEEAWKLLQPEQQDRMRRIAQAIVACETASQMIDVIDEAGLENDEKAGLWSLLDSKTRAAIKKAQAEQ